MRTDVQTDKQDESVAFRNFANEPKKESSLSECWQKCRADHAGPRHVIKVLFVNKYLRSSCATQQHFKPLDKLNEHTLVWRTNTVAHVHDSVPSPPY